MSFAFNSPVTWKAYIHTLRKREIDIIFNYLGGEKFDVGLEIGAGDGFQSKFLKNKIETLHCTELNESRLIMSENKILYKICDAEKISEYFPKHYFDFIFSSNLLEHLPKPELAISGMNEILKKDGLTIHIMPNQLWVLCHLFIHYPRIFLEIIKRIYGSLTGSKPLYKSNSKNVQRLNNNLKIQRNRGKISKIFILPPHGVSRNNLLEFFAFRKKRWIKEFEKMNFEIVALLKGPFSSGYGFGFDKIRTYLEKLNITTEYIYVFKKTS